MDVNALCTAMYAAEGIDRKQEKWKDRKFVATAVLHQMESI